MCTLSVISYLPVWSAYPQTGSPTLPVYTATLPPHSIPTTPKRYKPQTLQHGVPLSKLGTRLRGFRNGYIASLWDRAEVGTPDLQHLLPTLGWAVDVAAFLSTEGGSGEDAGALRYGCCGTQGGGGSVCMMCAQRNAGGKADPLQVAVLNVVCSWSLFVEQPAMGTISKEYSCTNMPSPPSGTMDNCVLGTHSL